MTPVAIDASNGFIAAPCHGSEAGVIGAGAGDSDEAFTVKLEIPRVVDVTLDLDNFGSEGETVESFGRFGREGRGFCEVDRRRERERGLRQAWELKEREEDVRANDDILRVYGVRERQGSELGFQSSLLCSAVQWLWREGKGRGWSVIQGSDIVTTDVDKVGWIWGGGGDGGRERGRQRPNRRSETVEGRT
ncbi:hypothetical protein OIU85_001357 [Salix viminalis]|uniref:Uncharacterized protein n=1 Tax=Salix viminalis TaxID=40686 RepID=A0A9Q0VLL0_SALVM|nr:hypothetical protein OIU85_001357 [Salix viminalis]